MYCSLLLLLQSYIDTYYSYTLKVAYKINEKKEKGLQASIGLAIYCSSASEILYKMEKECILEIL